VEDQRWDGNFGQPIDIVGPKAAPPDCAHRREKGLILPI
jgi:hypothetical protein